ncbi:adhesin [Alkalihalophilus pseudofirmus]|uniref:acyltransferase family protein n=1 Tax=Alkalihalophilus pseudofirmus TaxID=79885 RepID=UPI000952C2D0|nr:adhesin [Alkalihalophilus pseudofirmus]
MSKQYINEAFWLRAISCLAVAVTHAVNTTLANYEHTASELSEHILILIRFMAFFGTPAFVFISELLLAKAYPNHVPEDFFKKRVMFLLIPFISIGILFALVISHSWEEALLQSFKHIFLGGYYGYFILIIFQFYILHVLLQGYLKKWSPKVVLPIALIINLIYLGFFNFTEPGSSPVAEYIWLRGYWVPFFGWIFYFVLGYYCGKNYEALKALLLRHKWKVLVMPPVSIVLLVLLVTSDILSVVSSKRIDMLLYTVSMIFVIILFTMRFDYVPPFIRLISKYSFNIYLLHKFFLFYMGPVEFLHPLLYFIAVFILSVGASILLAKLLSPIKISQYVIGRQLVVPDAVKGEKMKKN